jgi:acetylornithine deacetylase/succinyl-diaminopimelate desuccinylase-like protein
MHNETVEILKKLITIKSQFPEESNLGEYIDSYLTENGFKTKRQYLSKNRFNLFAEKGKTGKAILFYGHMDTVPAYGSWKTNPINPVIVGDRLYGLGASDMKGGIAAVLSSLSKFGKNNIKLLFCVDEENISAGVWKAITAEKPWFNNVSLIVSAEAGDSQEHSGGPDTITLGRRGRVVMAINVKGASSHAATSPEKGINAIDEAAKIVTNMSKFEYKKHTKLGNETIFINKIEGSATSLSLPESTLLQMDMQLVTPEKAIETKKRVEKYLEKLYSNGVLNKNTKTTVIELERETPYMRPYIVDPNNHVVKRVLKLITTKFGKFQINYGRSVADDNALASLGIPIMTIGPTGGNEHTANEWVSIKSVEELTSLYEDIASSGST